MTKTYITRATSPVVAVPHEMFLRGSIILIGLAEAFVGLANLLPGADTAIAPHLLPVGLGRSAVMALRLSLGSAAIGFAVTNRFRLGLATLALWSLARWITFLVSLNRDAVDVFLVGNTVAGALAFFQTFLQPVLIAGALTAAWRNRYLASGTIAVGAMTFVDLSLFEVILFTIAVTLNGA